MSGIKEYKRSFILLSGGIDSTTCLYIAKKHHEKMGGKVVGVSIDYGQRHNKEIDHAHKICIEAGIKHELIEMSLPKTMLTTQDSVVPDIDYSDIKGISPTYVPFRNGAMLSMLASHAQGYVEQVKNEIEPELDTALEDLVTIYFGAHAEDAENWAYPDCTPEFIGAMTNAIYVGTYRTVRLSTPLTYMTKAEIIQKGQSLGVPYELTWSCYKGGKVHCGTCPTCRARRQAFEDAGAMDFTKYANGVK